MKKAPPSSVKEISAARKLAYMWMAIAALGTIFAAVDVAL